MTDLLAKRYAKAFFDFCQERGTVESGLKDLKEIPHLISESKEFSDFLENPTIPSEKAQEVLQHIFKDRFAQTTYLFLLFLKKKNRLNLLGFISDAFDEIYAESKNIFKVKIKSCLPLTKPQVDQICQHLKQKFKKEIEPQLVIDPDTIGGFSVQIGDLVYDYTFRTQLKLFKDAFVRT